METYYSAKERRAQILQLLKSSPKILVSSLSQMFNISEVTIRKDLEELENRNLLIRVRGGAIRLPKLNIAEEQATTEKKRFHYREKRSIGRMAATLIQENETIILDSGSTTMEIAKNLHSFKQLTIITNAIDIAIELSKYKRFNVILLGVAAQHMDYSKEEWLNVIEKTVPPKTVEMNKKAFLTGYELK